jgi:hypothetical protein
MANTIGRNRPSRTTIAANRIDRVDPARGVRGSTPLQQQTRKRNDKRNEEMFVMIFLFVEDSLNSLKTSSSWELQNRSTHNQLLLTNLISK